MSRPSNAVLKHREEARRYYARHRSERLKWQSEYNKTHREERREKASLRRKAHPIRTARLKREDYFKNREKRLATVKAYGLKHREEKAAISREWRKRHPRWAKALRVRSKHNYRARLAGVDGSFTLQQFRDLCKVYNNSCIGCGKSEHQLFKINRLLVPDHVKPISLGGQNYIGNIQPLCHPMLGGRGGCNSSKHNKEIDFRYTSLAVSLMREAV
jgi:hypothetical protein